MKYQASTKYMLLNRPRLLVLIPVFIFTIFCACIESHAQCNPQIGSSQSFICGNSVGVYAQFGASSYQWYKDGVSISGAKSSSITISAGQGGSYFVVASINGCGTVASNSLTIPDKTPVINSFWPSGNNTICEGGSVQLNISAASGYTYQWLKDGSIISGATGTTYVASQNGDYSCLVYNGTCYQQVGGIPVNVVNPTIMPSGSTMFCSQGQTVVLNTASNPRYTYQWKKDGAVITGAIGASYTASAVGNYSVTITYAGAQCTSQVLPVTSSGISSVSITPSADVTVCQGTSLSFSTSAPANAYQWRKDGVPISGATSPNYTFTAESSGIYFLVVNAGGCTYGSNSVTVTVKPSPTASISGPAYYCAGNSATLTAVQGTGYNYEWRKNGVPVSGQNNPVLAVNTPGAYQAYVSMSGCSKWSNTINVSSGSPADLDVKSIAGECNTIDRIYMPVTEQGVTYELKRNDGFTQGIRTGTGGEISWANITAPAGTWTYSVLASSATCTPFTLTKNVIHAIPMYVYNVTGGGIYCAQQPVSVGLENSQHGLLYELYRDGILVSSIQGTGSALGWNNIAAKGIYTVKAGNGPCAWEMRGSVVVSDGTTVAITASSNTTFCLGSNVLLQAPPIEEQTYQWKKNGVDIPDATKSGFEAIEGGTYQVVNGCGALSNSITLTALPSPSSDLFSNDGNEFCEGKSILLKSTSSEDYTYQWQRNGRSIPGATLDEFVVSETGLYEVVIKASNNCSTTSKGFSAVMTPTPEAYVAASGDPIICQGESITLHTADKQGYSYKWQKDDVSIPGATGSIYSTKEKGFYSVTTTIKNCTATSDLFEVVVNPVPPPITSITGEILAEVGKSTPYVVQGVDGASRFIWSVPMDAALTPVDIIQRSVNIRFSSEGEEVIKVYAEKNNCLSAAFEKIVRVRPQLITPTGIPQEVKVSREGRQPAPAIERHFLLKSLSNGNDHQVIQAPPCLDGSYYVGFQLYYDLGDQKTVQDWSSTLTIGFMRGDLTLWEEPLKVDMTSQTFIATIFHDKLIACADNYHIVIRNKLNTGVVPEENIYLKILLYKQAVDVFSPPASFSFNCNYSAADGQTLLSWNYTGKASLAYDLEWVFIDNLEGFTGTTPQQAFKFKASIGITTASQSYKHLTYYPTGRIWYRIRAVGYNPQYPEHRILGQWYYHNTALSITNHEQNRTWQQQTAFADEGKYKKIIYYLDGTLRKRQSQTNLSTENITLVAESLYDFEGRKVGDILPVPATDAKLSYKPAFNRFVASDPLVTSATSATRKKFHYDNRRLENSILSNTSGAARYFSSANVNASIHKDYIPDAEGYVYNQIEYLNDGTERVSRQSGVGKTFKMDGSSTNTHISRNHYGEALTAELVRLFGSNVGTTSHYKKTMTVSANGQATVSYHDQEGEVIATALAGEPPKNMAPLKSYTDLSPDLITADIADKNKITKDKSETVHKFLNVSSTPYTFSYDLASLAAEAGSYGCQSCVFDLKITITDPDGKLVDLGTIAGNESGHVYAYERKNLTTPNNCTASPLNAVSFQLTLRAIGDYTLTKTLIPRDRTFEDMRLMIMENASVQQQLQAIRDSYVLDNADCAICTSCPEAETAITDAIDDIATQDCENILNKIRHKLIQANLANNEYEPSQVEIEAHPLYCSYTLCTKDKKSDTFEKQLARVDSWSMALSKGYNNAVDIDPFFNDPALTGYTYKSTMQAKLNNIIITDKASFKGRIDQVTDPANAAYRIDASGTHNVNGYHILYYDLMQKQGQVPDPDYAAKLESQRWSFYKNFYLEAKRKLKLSIQPYQMCDSTREELQRSDKLPTTSEEITAWGERYGVPGVVSDEELEMTIYNIRSTCGIKLTSPDSIAIAGHLRAYFDGDKKNFFRVILKTDLGINPSLVSIQTILTTYGCSLTSDVISTQNPVRCMECIGQNAFNLIVNPNFSPLSGCPAAGTITTDCYDGWKPAHVFDPFYSSTPYLSHDKSIVLDANMSGESCAPDGLMGRFTQPLIPGHRYQLKFKYRATQTGSSYNQIMLSMKDRSGFALPDVIESGSQGIQSPSLALPKCDYYLSVVFPDKVTFDEGAQSKFLWNKTIYSTIPDYQSVVINFTAESPSIYLFFIHNAIHKNTQTNIHYKDFELLELVSCNENSICIKYDDTPFKITRDWVKEAEENCKFNAGQEREYLIQYASEKFVENAVTEFHNSYRSNCLAIAVEKLKYQYVPKEYHYTLYYYDQAKNLVQTVPPEGVKPLTTAQVNAFLAGDNLIQPAHTLLTRYQYQSLNQLIKQHTPDAGMSKFWYNSKGQLRLSQNAQQLLDKKYSYTKYDEQGRIAEVGELNTTEITDALIVKLESLAFPERSLYTLTDITRTHYDKVNDEIQSYFVQRYLRSRVSWVEVIEKDAAEITATYYSYDIHGNVKSLLQRLPGLGLKRTDYSSDLITGKVNHVFYQYGQPDQFIHKYTYGADNRITAVYTSTDGFIWDKEARYQYYLHGTLARVELGEYRVQGQDYYYTLHGWMKGVNIPYAGDPGQDGINGSKVGKDAYAYTLGYFSGDYKPINSNVVLADTRDHLWSRTNESFPLEGEQNSGLYNGNIAWMITDLAKIGEVNNNRTKGVQGMLYKYDQLNRITRSRSLANYSAGGVIPAGFMKRSDAPAPYDEDYSYDGNGNLLTLKRMNEQGALLDGFNYQYYSQTNRLKATDVLSEDKVYSSGPLVSNTKLYRNVTLSGTAYTPAGADVVLRATDNITVNPEVKAGDGEFRAYITEDQGNYQYNAIGNLIADDKGETTIAWNLYGKIREVQVGDTTLISFRYDAAGNRVEKKVQRPHSTNVTRYVRDGGGNVMGVYINATLTEQPIYGTSRLGQYTGGRKEGYRTLGAKKYELSNHLGNVLTVITDNVGMDQGNVWAKVETANDYYSYGMLMKGRTYSSNKYRYGFNGKEMDNEVAGDGNQYDYGFRIYNPRIAKFLSVDPLTKQYPMLTPYQFASNNPIRNIDIDGLEGLPSTYVSIDETIALKAHNYKGKCATAIIISKVALGYHEGEIKTNDVTEPDVSEEVTGYAYNIHIYVNGEGVIVGGDYLKVVFELTPADVKGDRKFSKRIESRADFSSYKDGTATFADGRVLKLGMAGVKTVEFACETNEKKDQDLPRIIANEIGDTFGDARDIASFGLGRLGALTRLTLPDHIANALDIWELSDILGGPKAIPMDPEEHAAQGFILRQYTSFSNNHKKSTVQNQKIPYKWLSGTERKMFGESFKLSEPTIIWKEKLNLPIE